MIIGIWCIIIMVSIIIIGEIKYQYCDKRKTERENKVVSKEWEDNVDTDMDKLFMEYASGDFVSSQVIAMRGSWRLAQSQVMGKQAFNVLRAEEYSKML